MKRRRRRLGHPDRHTYTVTSRASDLEAQRERETDIQ